MSLFSAELKQKIDGFLTRYETRRSAIIPILHAIQDECRWISEEHIEALHNEYNLDRVDVREVMTFYSLYRSSPPAKYEILFCDNIVCSMMGAKETMDKINACIKKFHDRGEKAPFSLEGVPCLGVCDGAPAMLVNKDRHLRVCADNVDAILAKYK